MVLFCSTAEDMEGLTDEDRIVIYALASELVVAVENSRLYKLTRRLAVTDELTGMSNYRYLQQRLDEEVTRAKRYGKHLSLLMMDADDFKGFNDRYGHIAGDMALAEFGGVLASIVREVDVVARYGGEEFAIVLPETDAAGAYVVAEKIREAIASHLFPDADGDQVLYADREHRGRDLPHVRLRQGSPAPRSRRCPVPGEERWQEPSMRTIAPARARDDFRRLT